MPSFASLLKHMRNFNQIHIEEYDVVEFQRTKYGETFTQCAVEIEARPIKRLQRRCPKCMSEYGSSKKCPGYDYKRETPSKWRTIDCFGIPTYLVYRPQRIVCEQHGVVTEYIPWADGKSRFTSEFNDLITFMSCRTPMSTISELYDISWETIAECVKHTLARIEPDRSVRLEGVTHICVDETSFRKGYSYITVVFDMNRCRVIWIGEGVGDETYTQFINSLTEEQRSKIVLVAADGARWVDRGMVHFPNAMRGVDPFHVIGWVQEAMDTVRKMVASKAAGDLRRYQEQCMKEAREAQEAAIKLQLEIERTQAELSKMPKRGCESKRKKELKAYLESLLAEQQAQNGTCAGTTLGDEETAEPAPVLTEEERAKYQSEYDAMPKRGKKSARKKELERLLGIKQKPVKATRNTAVLTPEQEKTLDDLKRKAADIKGARFALYHNPENRTNNQSEKLKWIEASCPDLYKAYQLKEQLRVAIHMTDADTAEKALLLWIEDAKTSGLSPMVELAEKIKRHIPNILNSIRFKANSARSESCNTTIKALICMAHGFKNVDNLIALIFLRCSDLEVPLFNRPFKSREYKAQQREKARCNRQAREARKRSA